MLAYRCSSNLLSVTFPTVYPDVWLCHTKLPAVPTGSGEDMFRDDRQCPALLFSICFLGGLFRSFLFCPNIARLKLWLWMDQNKLSDLRQPLTNVAQTRKLDSASRSLATLVFWSSGVWGSILSSCISYSMAYLLTTRQPSSDGSRGEEP